MRIGRKFLGLEERKRGECITNPGECSLLAVELTTAIATASPRAMAILGLINPGRNCSLPRLPLPETTKATGVYSFLLLQERERKM